MKVQFESIIINGHFEKLTVYVTVYGHRINEAFIYPTENGYELIVAHGYKDDKFIFTKLNEAFCFAKGMVFAHKRAGYYNEHEWRMEELRTWRKAYQKHKSKSL